LLEAIKKLRKLKAVVVKANVAATKKLKPKAHVVAIRKPKLKKLKVLAAAIKRQKALAVAIKRQKALAVAIKRQKLKKTQKANVAKANAVVRKKANPFVFV
jgi:hypothetical protein